MSRVRKVTQTTHHKFLNMYDLDILNRKGGTSTYYLASRAETADDLKLNTRENKPDGVVIYALYGEQRDRVVLVRQYRFTVGDYVYEFPAGLVDEGEDFHDAGIRELREETGLTFHPIETDPLYNRPYFTSIGMTDESCAAVYGTADGEISKAGLEDTEDIEVVLADRAEIRRILKEEKVAIICAYMLMHFLSADSEDPFAFLGRKGR